MDRGAGQAAVHGITELDMTLRLTFTFFHFSISIEFSLFTHITYMY